MEDQKDLVPPHPYYFIVKISLFLSGVSHSAPSRAEKMRRTAPADKPALPDALRPSQHVPAVGLRRDPPELVMTT